MQLVRGNLWYWHGLGNHVGITTNATINRRLECVMGRGVALEAKRKFPELPRLLASHLMKYTNVPGYFEQFRIFTVPVKQHYFAKAEIPLIVRSLDRLEALLDTMPEIECVYLPMPGCGAGGLKREDVYQVLMERNYTDRLIVTEIGSTNNW